MKRIITVLAIGAILAACSTDPMINADLLEAQQRQQIHDQIMERYDADNKAYKDAVNDCWTNAERQYPGGGDKDFPWIPKNVNDYPKKEAFLQQCTANVNQVYGRRPDPITTLTNEVLMSCIENTDMGAVECSNILSKDLPH